MNPERLDAFSSSQGGKPGAILAREREAQGLSIEQVADQLKLAPRQIIALEKDNFAALPGMAVVRGFVRAYAKYLKLDAAPLVAMITVESGLGASSATRREIATPFAETRMPSMSRRSMTPLWIAGSGIVLCIIIVLTIMQLAGKWPATWTNLSKSDTTSSASSGASGVASSAASAAEVSVVAIEGAASTPSSVSTTEIAIATPSPTPTPVAANTTPAPTATPTPTPSPANAGAATNTANNNLVLRLKQDSWVEVKRSNGQVLVSRIMRAGNTETIDMSSPVLLVVGNVNGVEANLRGASLNLKNGAGNTARLNVK